MSNFKERLAQVEDTQEIFENPHHFGLPTFEEFSKNTDKFMGRDDDAFSQVDKGSQQLNKHVQRHLYEIEGYRCKSLEEVERVASSQGIRVNELDYKPELMPIGAGKCDILVKFVSKAEREKRNSW